MELSLPFLPNIRNKAKTSLRKQGCFGFALPINLYSPNNALTEGKDSKSVCGRNKLEINSSI